MANTRKTKVNDNIARMMPNNLEIEQAVLGCALIDDIAASSILSYLSEKDFYSEIHQIIFEAMRTTYVKGSPVDYLTLNDELDRIGSIDKVGGTDYLLSLSNAVPSAAHYEDYVKILKNYSVNRSLIYSCENIIGKAYNADEDSLASAEKAVFELGESGQNSDLTPISNSIKEVMDSVEEAIKTGGKTTGILSGFYAIDNMTNGFHKSDLILIAARPSVGKTALGISFIINAAKAGKSCAFFDLEMSKEQIVLRMLSNLTAIDMMKISSGRLTPAEMKKVITASKELNSLPIYIDDSSLNTPGQIMSKCRKLKREKGLDIVLIDYLQLMSPEKQSDSRQQDVSDISRRMKIFAKELNVPVLLLSQLSRAVEQRKDKLPVLSDLRESGAIEQDADIVMFIHRPDEMKGVERDGASADYEVDIIFAKHRNGKVGSVKLGWKGSRASYVNLEGDANKQSLMATAPPPAKNDDAGLVKVNEIPSIMEAVEDSKFDDDMGIFDED